jgi:hypothetical protein
MATSEAAVTQTLAQEMDRLSAENVQLVSENLQLRNALSAAMDICESAYGCPEWLRAHNGRTAARDKAMEDIQKILGRNGHEALR